MRTFFCILITKLLIFAGKLFGKKGSSAPGSIALRLCPDILKKLSSQVREGIIAVCGTNGKTTTNNLIFSALSENGKKVVCNNVGANMLPGIVTAFVSKSNLFGKLDADYACLEIDEISTIRVYAHLKPKYMVITNLFRDQIDRYGAIDTTLEYLEKAINMADGVTLVLNGDDPILSAFGKRCNKKCVYFGVGEKTEGATSDTKDGRFCRLCGAELEYEFYHYSQLGKYECPECGFKRPEIDFEAFDLDLNGHLDFSVSGNRISVNYRGFYNIYNILACYGVLSLTGESIEKFQQTLKNYKPENGRMEEFIINGKSVILNLAKNPAGFNQAISTVIADKRDKEILLSVNDNPSDGIDVSWLWDVDAERLIGNCKECVVSGMRYLDVALRLKYAGIEKISPISDLKSAIIKAIEGDSPVCYLLVNYTELFKAQDILKKMKDGVK